MTPEQKLLSFRSWYEAEIGRFPGDSAEESKPWLIFVVKIPEERIAGLVRATAEDWGGRPGKPRLREFRATWQALRASEYEQGPPKRRCGLCEGSGYIVVPARLEKGPDGKTAYRFPGETTGVLSTYAFPCRCGLGRKIQARDKIPEPVCVTAREVLLDLRKSAGYQQEAEPISLREFMKLRRNTKLSPSGLAIDLVIESLVENGQVDEEGMKRLDAQRNQSGRTIAALEKRFAAGGAMSVADVLTSVSAE